MSEDKFKLSDLNNPLYEHSQVITLAELVGALILVKHSHDNLKWYQIQKRYEHAITLIVLKDMIEWLQAGKNTKQLSEEKK